MNEEQAFKVLEAVNNAYDSLDRHDALASERLELAHSHLKLMQGQITVLHEIIDEKNEEIRLLLAQVKDWKSQFDIALNERNEVMDENASARSVHEALVRNLTSMCNTAAKAFAERDAALAEVKRLTPIADAQYSSYRLAGLYMAERDRARAERDEARRLLKAVVDMMRDNMAHDATHPHHLCDFIHRPDIGMCKVCEDWTDAMVMCYPDDFQDEEDGK